jgi:thioredoxin-related protein
MKKYALYALLLIVAVGRANAADGGINFQSLTWEQAFQKAKSENKFLYIDAYADWCGPCKQMAATTFMNKDVAAYMNEHYVAIKVDVESADGKNFSEKYEVQYLPTSFFFNPQGEEKVKEVGFKDAATFLMFAKRARGEDNSVAELEALKKKLAAGDSSDAVVGGIIMKQILLKETEGLATHCAILLENKSPEVLQIDTFFYAYYMLDQHYNDPFNVYTRANYHSLYQKHGSIVDKKAVEMILVGIDEAVAHNKKAMLKPVEKFYLVFNPDGKKKDVRKVYREQKRKRR